MSRSVLRLLAPLVLALLPLVGGCGGRTGFEVRVDTPPDLQPGVDFDNLRVQVDTEHGSREGKYPISARTEKPYRVYVFNDNDLLKATLRVFLLKAGEIKKEAVKPSVPFEDGEIKEVIVDFN